MPSSRVTVQSAQLRMIGQCQFIDMTFSDGTRSGIYLNDGSPRGILHELLDEWIAAGNTIVGTES